MAFRHISKVLQDVMAGVEAEQRASVVGTNASPRQRVKFEEVAGGVEAPANARKRPSPKARPSGDREESSVRRQEVTATDTTRAHANPVLRLVMGGRELQGVGRRTRSIPASASCNSLMLVLIVGGRHASTWT